MKERAVYKLTVNFRKRDQMKHNRREGNRSLTDKTGLVKWSGQAEAVTHLHSTVYLHQLKLVDS